MAGKPETDQDFVLWYVLHQAADAIARNRQRELTEAGIGITLMHAAVLHILKTSDEPATPAEIARLLFREPPSVFVLLKEMERRGLITRTKDLERGNMVRVSITEKGKHAYREASMNMNKKVVHDIFSCLSEEERTTLYRITKRLRKTALMKLGVRRLRREPTVTMPGCESP